MGPLTIWVSDRGVRRIEFGPLPAGHHVDPPEARGPELERALAQLEEYLAGERRLFDLAIDLASGTTPFQRQVYDRLLEVPYGHVASYGRIAGELGRPDLARAVGQAVGANPVPIVIPCHRVVGSDRRLTGFGGGLAAKIALLRLEGVAVDGTSPSSRVHPEVIPLDL